MGPDAFIHTTQSGDFNVSSHPSRLRGPGSSTGPKIRSWSQLCRTLVLGPCSVCHTVLDEAQLPLSLEQLLDLWVELNQHRSSDPSCWRGSTGLRTRLLVPLGFYHDCSDIDVSS